MSQAADPFVHHPELRGKIADPLQSFMRSVPMAELAARFRARGLPVDWWHSDEEREACRGRALEGRRVEDLWLFAYGSLMWDPGVRFAEVRRARVADHARRFILKDVYGGRGTREKPGLMAALDRGAGCEGLAFRIPRADIEEETRALWRRERIGPAYVPAFVDAVSAAGPVSALTFVADHGAAVIQAGLTRAEQVEYLRTGVGILGSSLEYLRNIAAQFAALGIEDVEVASLLGEVEGRAGGGSRP